MYASNPNFDNLHRKSIPGFSFTHSQRNLRFPTAPQYINDQQLTYHMASRTQKIYSPFQGNYYLPPHLNSSKMGGNVFKGECAAWQIRSTHAKRKSVNNNKYNSTNTTTNTKNRKITDRNEWNWTTNYDVQYRTYQSKIKALPHKDYPLIQSRIKYLINQDRDQPAKLVYASDDDEEEEEEEEEEGQGYGDDGENDQSFGKGKNTCVGTLH